MRKNKSIKRTEVVYKKLNSTQMIYYLHWFGATVDRLSSENHSGVKILRLTLQHSKCISVEQRKIKEIIVS